MAYIILAIPSGRITAAAFTALAFPEDYPHNPNNLPARK
jgi:hypothetical protein